MRWTDKSPINKDLLWKETFKNIVSYIPDYNGWFGIAAKTLDITTSTLSAKSTAGSIFVGIAKVISEWVHTVADLIASMFIVPPLTKGNRWIEHIRNTYVDYGLTTELNTIVWEKQDGESVQDYEVRLDEYANNLINLFRKQTITKDALEKSLQSILGNDAVVTLVEPITQLKPWPGPEQYRSTQLSSESDSSYLERLSYYDALYMDRKKLDISERFARPNTRYPLPANATVKVDTYEEDESTKNLRITALKRQLGSYNYLGGTVSRRFSSDKYQGGRLEVTIAASKIPENILDTINSLKAAGVQVTLYVYQVLETATSTSSVDGIFTTDLQKTILGVASTGNRVHSFHIRDND